MLKYFFLLCFVYPVTVIWSQSAEKFCITDEKVRESFRMFPEKKVQYEKLMEEIRKRKSFSSEENERMKSSVIYTIPVVFHILHVGGTENISDAQVIDAVNILTRDFRKNNPDITQVQPSFAGITADVQIEFRLATKDPNGNCTNGIIRHYDPETLSWDGDPSEYKYTWPPNMYLNIYVVKTINFNAAGYTYFPGTSPTTDMDAIVVLSNYVGSIGTSNPFTSRVLTHEVGHWLSLPHVWGFNNNPGQVCGDDGIMDTPVTKGWTSCNLTNNDVCTPGIHENVENYMEYAYCSKMFTLGQANAMQNTLMSFVAGRNNLSTSTNLIQTGVVNPSGLCAPQITVVPLPTASTCPGGTVSVVSYTNNGVPTSYSWSASGNASVLTQGQFSTAVLVPSAGSYTVSCVAGNSAGISQSSVVVYAVSYANVIQSGMTESFESTSLPNGWSTPGNTNPSLGWKITNQAASDGNQSMYIQGEVMPAGRKENLQTPPYDFLNNPGAGFTYKYAYARKSTSSTDMLRIYASKDCGGSWKMILSSTSSFLSNGSGGVNSNVFIPASNQWKFYQLDAHPNFYEFLSEPQVVIRFQFMEDSVTGFGNRFYLDEINFLTPSGVLKNEYIRYVKFYPNPAFDKLNIQLAFSVPESSVRFRIFDLKGKLIKEEIENTNNDLTQEKTLDIRDLNSGMYMLEITGRKILYRGKLIKL
jgi:hypothetical protein